MGQNLTGLSQNKEKQNLQSAKDYYFDTSHITSLQSNLYCPTKKAYQRLLQILKQYEPQKKQELQIPSDFQKGTLKTTTQYFYISSYNLVYQGEWKQNKPHGKGNIYFQDGALFRGFFKNGIPYGTDNLFIFKDGSYYRGQIQNNSFNGKGTFHSDSVTFNGNWRNGLPHGEGHQIFMNKNEYIGNFVQGFKQGQNQTFKWNNHQFVLHKYEGGFKKGWFNGKFIVSLYEGKKISAIYNEQKIQNLHLEIKDYIFQGQLDRQFLNGKGKIVHKTIQNHYYQGQVKNGKIHGKGKIKLQNQKQKQTYWINGIMLQQIKGSHKDNQIEQILLKIRQLFKSLKKYSLVLKSLKRQVPLYDFTYDKIDFNTIQNIFSIKIGKKTLNCFKIK